MSVEVKAILNQCIFAAKVLGNSLGLKLAVAINRVVAREFGAEQDLFNLWNEVPDSLKT